MDFLLTSYYDTLTSPLGISQLVRAATDKPHIWLRTGVQQCAYSFIKCRDNTRIAANQGWFSLRHRIWVRTVAILSSLSFPSVVSVLSGSMDEKKSAVCDLFSQFFSYVATLLIRRDVFEHLAEPTSPSSSHTFLSSHSQSCWILAVIVLPVLLPWPRKCNRFSSNC
jgi:hypothetical protein